MKILIFLLIFFSLPSSFYGQNCHAFPEFLSQLGFNGYNTAFSTNEIDKMGIVAYELKDRNDLHSERLRFYQGETWSRAGYLGTIVFDEIGNIYIAPLPKVNTLDNPPEDQNTIYYIDSKTGIMEVFYKLPVTVIPNSRNPFGIMGVFYDCPSNSLFISTISGSTSDNEMGKIFSLNAKTKELREMMSGVDALGLAILYNEGERYLIYGEAKKSTVLSVRLDEKNNIISDKKLIIDLTGLGFRGDDKARKFQTKEGFIDISAVPFMYNLVAPRKRQENIYSFQLNKESQRWELISFR